MKRLLSICLCWLVCGFLLPATAASSSSALASSESALASSESALVEQPKPADSTFWAKSMGTLHRQLAGECYFDIPCATYFVEACRSYGLLKATMIAFDMRLRCSRIGMAGLNTTFLDTHGLMHEDIEAYRYRNIMPMKSLRASQYLPYDSLLNAERKFYVGTDSYISEDYDFARYLLSLDLKQDLSYMLRPQAAYHASDSLHYLRAWTEYLSQDLSHAAAHFSLVDSSSVFWEKSLFHEVALLAHLSCYEQAGERLQTYHGTEYQQLKALQGAGLALLSNRLDAYEQAAAHFDLKHAHYLQSDELALQAMYQERLKLQNKSPLVAAGLSAVVPGLGKIYAGNLSEGVMSFVITGAMAGITAEHILKQGMDDWRSITFASLTSLLYISNIFGSYFSVQILQDHVLQKQTQAVLYHIHIPLDRIFR